MRLNSDRFWDAELSPIAITGLGVGKGVTSVD